MFWIVVFILAFVIQDVLDKKIDQRNFEKRRAYLLAAKKEGRTVSVKEYFSMD